MAAYWAGDRVIDESLSDAVALGVKGVPEPEEDILEVIPEAWPALEIFLNVQTQWRVDSGNLIGLDYMAVKWVFDLLEVEKPAELLADLQVIEAKIVETLSKRSK